MLFSPRMWRRMIRPYAERVVKHTLFHGAYLSICTATVTSCRYSTTW